jgi:hypothetical protein
MARKDPAKVARKWASRVSQSQAEYSDSIRSLDKNPMEQAAAKKDTMRARVNQALDDGTWEAGLRRTDFAKWKEKTAGMGAQRLSQGAAAAEGDVLAYQQETADAVERIREEIKRMPNVTDEDRKARMLRNFDLMKALRKNRSR